MVIDNFSVTIFFMLMPIRQQNFMIENNEFFVYSVGATIGRPPEIPVNCNGRTQFAPTIIIIEFAFNYKKVIEKIFSMTFFTCYSTNIKSPSIPHEVRVFSSSITGPEASFTSLPDSSNCQSTAISGLSLP